MNILITGIDGFIGKNLKASLEADPEFTISGISRKTNAIHLREKLLSADFIVHLAGENRSNQDKDFYKNNAEFTSLICSELVKLELQTPILFSSTKQISENNIYGKTKKLAENELVNLHNSNGNSIFIFRLPGVYGKWAKPHYNSVVATFCYQIARDLDIDIHPRKEPLELVFIDDVISRILEILKSNPSSQVLETFLPNKIKKIFLDELADLLFEFKNQRKFGIVDDLAKGFKKSLYSTYLTYLPAEEFVYKIPSNHDERGVFTEFIKSKNTGQISFFTVLPDSIRGMHFHNQKIEKFLVLQGQGEFVFQDICSHEKYTFKISDKDSKVIETIPGFAHSIKNIGDNTLIILAYANEIFDSLNPDTYHYKINYEES